MTKKEKLDALDELVLGKMIEIMKDGTNMQELSMLSVPVNYLKANQVVAEKPKSSVEESVQKRLKEASERRKKGTSV